MHSPRIIRPLKSGSRGASSVVELNLEDLRALGQEMIREARDRVGEAQAERDAVSREIAVLREAWEREAAERRETLEAELAERRRSFLEELEAERAASLEVARAEGLDAGEREGFEKGYSDGLETGVKEGRVDEAARIAADIERLVPTLRGLVREFTERRNELLQGARGELIHLALQIARLVVKREVALRSREIVVANLAQAIELIFVRNKVVVQIHQDDLPAIERYARESVECFHGVEGIEVRPVRDIEPGGCRVLSGTGLVDLSIDVQLETIEKALLGEFMDERQIEARIKSLAATAHGRAAEAQEPNDSETEREIDSTRDLDTIDDSTGEVRT